MKKLFLLIPFLILARESLAQPKLKIGQWADYLPYNSAVSVARGNNKVYTATGVGVFAVNGGDNSLERLNKVYGLNDVDATLLRFNNYNNTLIIVYGNSNIDVLKGETITNFSDIKRKNITADKTILNVSFYKEFAYFSTGFGIVVFDTERMEFKDTYVIGNLGAYLKVYDVARDADTIYAATASGLKRASASINLSNYQNWSNVPGLPSGTYNNVVKFNSHFITNYSANLTSGLNMKDTLYYNDGTQWKIFPKGFNLPDSYTIKRILADEVYQRITLVDQWNLEEFIYNGTNYVFNGVYGHNLPFTDQNGNLIWPATQEGIYAPELGAGYYALATFSTGLVKTNGTSHFQLIIDGPDKNYVSQMALLGDKMVVAPVFLSEIWYSQFKSTGIYINTAGSWKNVMKSPLDNAVADLNCVAYLNGDPNHYFAGSWGDGLCEFRNDTLYTIHNESNSTLQPATTTQYSVRINGVASDTSGNLWVSNGFTTYILSVRKPDGSWKKFNFGSLVTNQTVAGRVMIDKNNQKWVLLPGIGFIVYSDGGNYTDPVANSNAKKITTVAGQGGLPSAEVFSIAEDQEGDIWIGCDKGVAVFYNPESILSSSSGWDCQQIIVDNGGIAKILLESETVLDIVVDGENRKWIATRNGVYCLSADGQKEIYHFTAENSPLFSNYVIDLEYNGKNGDVYFGTDEGIQSFRSEVIDPFEDFTDVYSYPNPVRPGYEGPIVIKGMIKDAVVKITDITGTLVYETSSKGGQAIWYGKNFKGERVSSGVYVVFCASGDGELKKLTKILLVN